MCLVKFYVCYGGCCSYLSFALSPLLLAGIMCELNCTAEGLVPDKTGRSCSAPGSSAAGSLKNAPKLDQNGTSITTCNNTDSPCFNGGRCNPLPGKFPDFNCSCTPGFAGGMHCLKCWLPCNNASSYSRLSKVSSQSHAVRSRSVTILLVAPRLNIHLISTVVTAFYMLNVRQFMFNCFCWCARKTVVLMYVCRKHM